MKAIQYHFIRSLLLLSSLFFFLGCGQKETCRSQSDCQEGYCSRSVCVKNPCSNNGDCQWEEHCRQGFCRPKSPNKDDAGIHDENPPPCTPTSCSQQQATCGTIPNGCGETLDCGTCSDGQTCGANNKPNQCGKGSCTPKTCSQQSAQCGDISDGCGNILNCGSCSAGQTCGTGTQANRCLCIPKTCSQQGAQCGNTSDGCGKTIQCGSCQAGQTCGANNKPNQCGKGPCVPKTCSQQGAQCGDISDGCGKVIPCGSCQAGKACGTGQNSNQCICKPKTCKELGKTCGNHDDGCGNLLSCGTCPECKPTCPQGYSCRQQVCENGNQQAISLDVRTIRLKGTVTLNGKEPKPDSTNCTNTSSGIAAMYVVFREVNHGYEFTYRLYCKSVARYGWTFSQNVFPGTYSIQVVAGESNLPETAQTVIASRDFKQDTSNIALDVRTIRLKGTVTLNGKEPKPDSTNCTNTSSGIAAMYVVFREVNHGYEFTYRLYCKSVARYGWTFSQTVFPGTYSIQVLAGESNLPETAQTVIVSQSYQQNTNGITLDVRTIRLKGTVTLNGKEPKPDSTNCTNTSSGIAAMYVVFREVNHGYEFTYRLYCKSVARYGWTFSQNVFPGTYSIQVLAGESNLPETAQTVIVSREFKQDTSNISLNVRTIRLKGTVTLNGKEPKPDSTNCTNTSSGIAAMYVVFREVNHGYEFTYRLYCKSVARYGWTFSQNVFPGTYSIQVLAGESNLPETAQTVIASREFKQDTNGIALDVRTIRLKGTVTLNGKEPKPDSTNCTNTSSGIAAMYVVFREVKHGYEFTYRLYCKSVARYGWTFSQNVFPGTYNIQVLAGESNLPETAQTVLTSQSYTSNQNGIQLDVKTVRVKGTVTLNGKEPKPDSTNCTNTSSGITAMYVVFREVKHGYEFTYKLYCKSVARYGWTFSQTVFPGTYSIQVIAGESNLPETAQTVVSRLKIE